MDASIDIISIVGQYRLITAQYLIDCVWMYKDNTCSDSFCIKLIAD